MSGNECQWWMAWRTIAPLTSEIGDIQIQAATGSRVDWFDPMKDDEYLAEQAAELAELNKDFRLKDG